MLFFPSHDIALANGVRHFNPPRAALGLQHDLADLWRVWNSPYLRGERAYPLPWGWDWDTRQHLRQAYRVDAAMLPTDADLEAIRQLSARTISIDLCRGLGVPTERQPRQLCSPQEAREAIASYQAHGQRFVLKTPWSSSGRGLTLWNTPAEAMLRHVDATIGKMGSILLEPWIDHKVQDFAMLFFASAEAVRYVGLSLFDNDTAGTGTTYRQGYLLSNDAITRRLGLDDETVASLARRCEQLLTELLRPVMGKTWDVGYLGIDMMTYRPTDEEPCPVQIHPCVELNLRCTMGVVCRCWHDEHGRDGIFRISPMDGAGHFHAVFEEGGKVDENG